MIASLLLATVATTAPAGTYVEARTAAVFAGACHYGGQYTTQGRDALVGWHFAAGEHAGVSLQGVDVVAVIAGEKNLDVAGSKRRSVIYVDADASKASRDAAVAWVRAQHAKLLGKVTEVKVAPVDVGKKKEGFWLTAGKGIELRGSALPERACCNMPYNVWYEPFAPVQDRLVGNAKVFRSDGKDLGRAWSRTDENDVFFGSFGKPAK